MLLSPIAKKDLATSPQLQRLSSGLTLNSPHSMDCLLSHLPESFRSIVEPYSPHVSAEHAQLIGVALVSLVAVYVGYCYILSCKEAAVTFNVPLPSEVRNSSGGKKWDEVQGQERRVLEEQARGVSVDAQSCSFSAGRLPVYLSKANR